MNTAYRIEFRQHQRTRPLGRPRDDNIIKDIRETQCEVLNWVQLNENMHQWGGGLGDFFLNTVINLVVL